MIRLPTEQALDDAFRDLLLGGTCFCGAVMGVDRTVLTEATERPLAMVVTVARRVDCAPLRCVAHGYCLAHSTPVAAQMSEDQKTRLMKRAGWMQG